MWPSNSSGFTTFKVFLSLRSVNSSCRFISSALNGDKILEHCLLQLWISRYVNILRYLKVNAHGMRPVRFLSACVWLRDATSFSDAFGMICVRTEPISILTHQTYCSDSLLLERRPYQTHQKRTWRHEIRRMRPKNAHHACRVHIAKRFNFTWSFNDIGRPITRGEKYP